MTPKQIRVLERVAMGQPLKAVASELGVPISTVQFHLTNVRKQNRIGPGIALLTHFAIAKGLVALKFALLILFCAFTASAASHTAATASTADVQTAVDAASDGDTVLIPNGSATWTTGIATTKQIIIRAQNYTATDASPTSTNSLTFDGMTVYGTTNRNVRITNNSASNPLFSFTTGSSYHCGLGGIAIIEGTGSANALEVSGTGSKVMLVFDMFFEVKQRNGDASSITLLDWAAKGGVVWNCVFHALDNVGGGPVPYGVDGSSFLIKPTAPAWATASTMGDADTGGTNNVYLEDSGAYMIGQFPDLDDNGRFVARHVIYNGTAGVTHGFTSTTGGRHFEFYNSTFKVTDVGSPWRNISGRYYWCRAGTGLFTDCAVSEAENTSEWGSVDLLSIGDTTTPDTYPQDRAPGRGHNGSAHVSDPIYLWSNTGASAYGVYVVPSPAWDTVVLTNRDFYANNGAKSGYTKYTYPHPLRSQIEGVGGGSPGGATANVGNLRIGP